MKKFILVAAILGTLFNLEAAVVSAAPPPVIKESVAVCDPNSPTHCEAPNTDGSVNVKVTGGTGGTVTANQGTAGSSAWPMKIDQTTPGTTNGVQLSAALPAGSAVIGKVTIDQTTPGTTNFVYGNISQLGGTTTPTGGGTLTASSPFIPCGGLNSSSGNGALICRVSPATGGLTIDGPTPSGSSAIGNPVPSGCTFNTTQPTITTGQRVECQTTARGEELVTISNGAVSAPVQAVSDGMSGTPNALAVVGYTGLASTGGFEARARDITLGLTTGIGTVATSIAPSSVAPAGIAPTVTSAVASSLIVKAAAGNLYHWTVTSGASAGFVMIFDATSAPADGAVTPKECVVVAANSTVRDAQADIPDRFTTGITIVFSTTGCFSKTASATAFIKADAL